jgi:hypothetical protein
VSGLTLASLAAHYYCCSRRLIERILRDAGVPIRRRGVAGPEIDAVEIVRLYRETGSMAQVARAINRNAKVVRRVLEEMGVEIDHRPGTRQGTPWAPKGGRRV